VVEIGGNMNEFSQKTLEKLNYYVYCLLDPRDNIIFYIGKGKGNRVFAHLKGDIKNPLENDKVYLIKDIIKQKRQVGHFIIRHGVDEKTALEIEATIIDLLTFENFSHLSKITNIMAGHGSWDRGIKTVNEIEALYAAQPLNEHDIIHKILIININQTYKPGVDPYEATRKYWKLNINNAKKVDFVLSEYHGIIRAVYKPIKWFQDPESKRWYFDGIEVNESEINQRYLNKVYHGKQRGAVNPIRYLPKTDYTLLK
jgi:hypothetical protein